jgi:hypothetical protein
LAALVATAAGKLGLERRPVPLALAGGLLLAASRYRQRVLEALAAREIRAEPVTQVQEPAEGAVRLALGEQARVRA